MRLPHIVSAALIIILGFSVYANSLNGEFLWDDDWLIKDNIYIRDLSQAFNIFTENRWTDTARRFHFYRPLQIFTYMIDYSLWKLDVRGYHLTNVALHILAGLSIYWLLNLLFGDRLLSLIAGTLFIVHPIHTEAIAYISGRADPLALTFMLLALVFYIRSLEPDNFKLYLFALLSYTGALFSRESSLVFPLLLCICHYASGKKIILKRFMPIAALTLIYIVFRHTVSRDLLPTYTEFSATFFERIPGFFVALAEYARLLLLPFGLHMEYGSRVFGIVDPRAIAGILIMASVLLYAFKSRSRDTIAFFSISWFFITLLPHSNIYPIRAYMAEHWLYMPSIGFFIVIAKGLSYLYKTKKFKAAAIIFTVALTAFFSYLTIRQNSYWRDPVSFYRKTLGYAPESALLHYNLANEYRALGRKKEAADLYEKAIGLNPGNAEAYNNLGTIYFDMEEKDKAIACYKKAIGISPDFSYPYCNLASTYNTLGEIDKAIDTYNKALTIEPDNALAHFNLAVIYFKRKEYEVAFKHCYKAKELGHEVDADFLKLLESYKK